MLNLFDTQTAIGLMKRLFEDRLAAALNLRRVSAPLFVEPHTGLNDDLDGQQTPVEFTTAGGQAAQIVHSLAKWKRMALAKYDFHPGKGLYTDMNAIRREEVTDALHSIYVDQWDWEKAIRPEDRTEEFLRETVRKIAACIYNTACELEMHFPALPVQVPREPVFISTADTDESEDALTRRHGCVFLSQISADRAPDYDDWALNGDLLYHSDILDCAVEISSMGVRVCPASLQRQLKAAGCEQRAKLPFHSTLINGEYPPAIGGGIGQSRLSMLLLKKAHIGQVQVSIWPDEMRRECEQQGVVLL
jgi:aspartate--ammonia ligase